MITTTRRLVRPPILVEVAVTLSDREIEAAFFSFPHLDREPAIQEYAKNKAQLLVSNGWHRLSDPVPVVSQVPVAPQVNPEKPPLYQRWSRFWRDIFDTSDPFPKETV